MKGEVDVSFALIRIYLAWVVGFLEPFVMDVPWMKPRVGDVSDFLLVEKLGWVGVFYLWFLECWDGSGVDVVPCFRGGAASVLYVSCQSCGLSVKWLSRAGGKTRWVVVYCTRGGIR